ncbi:hypothetical protein FXB38_09440 [Bradyrhizobium cytisi]|uniref:Uncharacterized protein n=1 Tax=Bradyrhizobium cytisi TaxID=515489 RepID=A0A5S4WW20_9BRAD|nr:hypothetical protein FXB38_09440 [Bradyrhizobium cytisi]
MAGLVPAIHVLRRSKDVDARVKPGHDGVCGEGGVFLTPSSSAPTARSGRLHRARPRSRRRCGRRA